MNSYAGRCGDAQRTGKTAPDTENLNTTNLTVADKWGNIVEYTLTIEQTGGSGIVVPGRGFLLNNELTDFTNVYDKADPNRIEGGKRPRSSISPTIVLRDGKPVLALGSPGGATIITTVLQMLFNRFDRGMSIEQAIEAPRASQRNTATAPAKDTTPPRQAFIDRYGPALTALGHTFARAGAGRQQRSRDRRRDGHRVRPRRPAHRRLRAHAPRGRVGAGGGPAALRPVTPSRRPPRSPRRSGRVRRGA